MIIRLEANGDPCLDSGSDKKVSLDILLPEQTYQPDRPVHPVLQNINTGYASSIYTVSDGRSVVTEEFSYPPSTSTTATPRATKRWRIKSPFGKQRSVDPLLSGSTMVDKVEKKRGTRRRFLPLSWNELSTKWLIGWTCTTLLLCAMVAISSWLIAKKVARKIIFQSMMAGWAEEETTIYNSPIEMFGCWPDPDASNGVVFNSSQQVVFVPYGKLAEHVLLVQGGGAGMVTLTSSPDPDARDIAYDLLFQGTSSLLESVWTTPPLQQPIVNSSTDMVISTPFVPPPSAKGASPCIRFDITMYLPRSLKKLTLNISTPAQVFFSPQGHIELEDLVVNVNNTHPRNRIDASEALHASSLSVAIRNGHVRGAVSVGDVTEISNRYGDTWLDVIPNASRDISHPTTAVFRTTTTMGMTNIRYLRNEAYRRRTIESYHTMSGGLPCLAMFDYEDSGFDGLLYTNSTKYNVTNGELHKVKSSDTQAEDAGWTYMVGNRTGADRIYVRAGYGKIVLP